MILKIVDNYQFPAVFDGWARFFINDYYPVTMNITLPWFEKYVNYSLIYLLNLFKIKKYGK